MIRIAASLLEAFLAGLCKDSWHIQVDMASLAPNAVGYLNPKHQDGASVAAHPQYTASTLQMSSPATFPILGGVDEDPSGAITVRRSKTGQSVQLFTNSSQRSIEDALRDMFSSYSQPLSVMSSDLWRNGTVQVSYCVLFCRVKTTFS